jgi:DNA-binding response OmpR family regulator
MSGERVLIVDDERPLLEAVAHHLRQAGYRLEVATSAEEALDRLAAGTFDVGIFDVMLPGISGFELCRRVRQMGDMPVIMLTARDAEDDRVEGLDSGADDYVVKPFSHRELISRLQALLRRRELDAAAATRPQQLLVGKLQIDRSRRRISWDARRLHLTPSEYELLETLATAAGRTVPRSEIVRGLWDSDHTGDERVCDVHVHSIRQKLRQAGGDPAVIQTIRGIGYALRAP